MNNERDTVITITSACLVGCVQVVQLGRYHQFGVIYEFTVHNNRKSKTSKKNVTSVSVVFVIKHSKCYISQQIHAITYINALLEHKKQEIFNNSHGSEREQSMA